MKNKITLITLLFAVSLNCPTIWAAETADQVLKETKVLYEKAEKLQGAWVTTGKLIKEAEVALKKGDQASALKLADKARTEARLSITQAEEQAKNWTEPPYIER
jgi:hypothetical protein